MSELHRNEDALLRALKDIRENWQALIPTEVKPITFGVAGSDSVSGLDRRISIVQEVTLCLNGWARIVVEDRGSSPIEHCTHGSRITLRPPLVGPLRAPICAAGIDWAGAGMHQIRGNDTTGLCLFLERHAQWFSGHEAVHDAIDELTEWAREIVGVISPPVREWINLGPCPFVVGWRIDDVSSRDERFCTGTVRAKADEDPTCSGCGQTAVVEWWQEVLRHAMPRMISSHDLAQIVHREFGRPAKAGTVRMWVSRGWVSALACKLGDRSMVFDTEDTIRALAERWAEKEPA